MSITISQAKHIREMLNATQVVLLVRDGDGDHVATHGESETDAREAATLGNWLKTQIQWPIDLCRSKPLPRVCKSCAYYKPDYGIHCFNGWSSDGSNGGCLVEPKTRRVGADHGCRYFEPKA